MVSKRKEVLKKLELPSHKAFHFYRMDGSYTGLSAHSLPEFIQLLNKIPEDSIIYHINRGDFQAWLKNVFGLNDLAEEIDSMVKPDLPIEELRIKLKSLISKVLA